MTRAYLRLDPAFWERKLAQGYPLPAIAALVGCICQAEFQPERGVFRDANVLRALLGPAGRWYGYLLEHRDLRLMDGGRVYVVGWQEWQEGDWKVGERVARIRAKRAARNEGGNAGGNAPGNGAGNDPKRYPPSDGGRLTPAATALRRDQGSVSGGVGDSGGGAPLRAPSSQPTKREATDALTRLGRLLPQPGAEPA